MQNTGPRAVEIVWAVGILLGVGAVMGEAILWIARHVDIVMR